MKKFILATILALITTTPTVAQQRDKVQIGKIRSMSFATKEGKPIKDAVIVRKDGKVNPAYSDSNGIFKLSMENLGSRQTFFIENVTVHGTDYKMYSPTSNDLLQHSPLQELLIIMQSQKETEEFVNRQIVKYQNASKQNLEDSIRKYKKLYDKSLISKAEADRKVNEFEEIWRDNSRLMEQYIRNIMYSRDFEQLDSLDQAKDLAIEHGDYNKALEILNFQLKDIDKQIKYDSIIKQNNQQLNDKLRERMAINEELFKPDSVLADMKRILRLKPNDVNILCEIGEYEERFFTNFKNAAEHYKRAIEECDKQEKSNFRKAVCHSRLANVLGELFDSTANRHFHEALRLLEPDTQKPEELKELYQIYLGLGETYYQMSDFEQAKFYYNKLINSSADSLNRDAYLSARKSLASIKADFGNVAEAQNDFLKLLDEINLDSQIKLETKNDIFVAAISLLSGIGKYDDALKLCQTAEEDIKNLSRVDNLYISQILGQKAAVLSNLGNFKEALEAIERAIYICREILGEQHPYFSNLSLSLAGHYMVAGKFNEANELITTALKIQENRFGTNHPATLNCHIAQFNYLKSIGQYENALLQAETINQIFQNSQLSQNKDFMQSILVGTALVKQELGYANDALFLLHEAEKMQIEKYGESSAVLIDIYANLSQIYTDKGEWKNAETYINKTIALSNKIYGSNNPVAILKNQLWGEYYSAKFDHNKVFEIYTSLEQIITKHFGNDNYNICNTLHAIGDCYLAERDLKNAKRYFDRSHQIAQNTFGESSILLAANTSFLSDYYNEEGNYAKSLELAKSALAFYENIYPNDSQIITDTKIRICNNYINLGEFDKAKQILDSLNATSLNYYNNLSLIYLKEGNFAKAIKSVEKAISIANEQLGKSNPLNCNLYHLLSNIYNAIPDTKKALESIDMAIDESAKYFNKTATAEHIFTKARIYFNAENIVKSDSLLNIVESAFKENYSDSSIMLSNVIDFKADLLIFQGKINQGLELKKNLEKIYLQTYGKESFFIVYYYNSLANSYALNGFFDDAISTLENNIEILKRLENGEKSYSHIQTLTLLGDIYKFSDYNKAIGYYEQALSLSTEIFGANSLSTLSLDARIGEFLLLQKDFKGAYDKFKKYNSSVFKTFGDETNINKTYANRYFAKYYIQKAFDEKNKNSYNEYFNNLYSAIDCYNKIIQNAESIFGENNPIILNDIYALIDLHAYHYDLDTIKLLIEKAYTIVENNYSEYSPQMAEVYWRKGTIYNNLSNNNTDNFREAKIYFEKSIDIYENEFKNYPDFLFSKTFNIKFQLSQICLALKEIYDAIEINEEQINYLEAVEGDKNELYYYHYSNAYFMKSLIYYTYDLDVAFDAIKRSNEAVALCSNFNNPLIIANAGLVFIRIAFELEDKSAALEKAEELKQYLTLLPPEVIKQYNLQGYLEECNNIIMQLKTN